MSYFFRNLHLNECQLDELWTFSYKKEDHLTPLDELPHYADALFHLFDRCRAVFVWLPARRGLSRAHSS